jgi:hypothetical protein
MKRAIHNYNYFRYVKSKSSERSHSIPMNRMYGFLAVCFIAIFFCSCNDKTNIVSTKQVTSKTIHMKVSPDTIVISSSTKPVRSTDPTTTIEFTIPEETYVLLVVYDDDNQLVATLINEILAPGTHEVSWSVDNLASGVYYFRLTAGAYEEIKKMLIVK